MKHMSPRLLKIATELADASISIPSDWTREDCEKAISNLDRLISALCLHSDAIEEETGSPCFETGNIAMALMSQMDVVEEAMKTR